jgi:hypothetical protein
MAEFDPDQLSEDVDLSQWLAAAMQADRVEFLKLAPKDTDPHLLNFIRVLMTTNQNLRKHYHLVLESNNDCNERLGTLIKDVESAIKQFKERTS